MQSHLIPKRVALLSLLIGACAILVYLPALNLGFVNWDDDKYVYENPHILTLSSSFLRWAFTTFEVGGNWHPLTWLSLGLDRLLWGTSPMGFHATNILLHGLNTALVTVLAALLFADGKKALTDDEEGSRISNRGMIAAAITGTLFGFHPIHVESVAWISERKDVLCAFFFFAGILAYLRYAWVRSDGIALEPFYRGRSSRFYFFTLLLFVLSLLSKPMAVTFPAVLLILDWHPLGRFESGERRFSVLLEKLPFFVLSVASSIVTVAGQTLQTVRKLPVMDRFLNGVHSLIMYIWKMLVPLNLLPYYPYPSGISPISVKYLSALLIVAGIAVSCVVLYKIKRGRAWIAAWGYYLVTLLPVIGFIQVGAQSMADRYTYLPSLGPFLLTSLGLAIVVEKKNEAPSESFMLRYSALIVLGILAVSLSSLTVRQTGIWKDGLTFWNYVIEKEPGRVDVAYLNRGNIYLNQGKFEEALLNYDTALTINPDFINGYSNRAQAYIRLNKHSNALKDLNTALTLSPSFVLGYVYRSMMYNWYGNHDKALADLTTAVTIKPDFVLGYYHRGNTNLSIGQYNRAIADFSTALSLAPNSPENYFHRGQAYLKSGNAKQAEQDFEVACTMGYREACRTEHK
jgi:tetratricopeptide (TPR) repeat protein